jgi:hypothetical protein
MEVSGQFHANAALTPRDIAPDIHCMGDWVDPRVGWEQSQVVAPRYINSSIPATSTCIYKKNLNPHMTQMEGKNTESI